MTTLTCVFGCELWDGRKVRAGETVDVSEADASVLVERDPAAWKVADGEIVKAKKR